MNPSTSAGKMPFRWWLLGLWLICLAIGVDAVSWNFPEWLDFRRPLYLAFAGDLGKDDKESAAWQGARIYIDEVNRRGGIEGRKIVLQRFNDHNEAGQAKERALEIATGSEALGVIGHDSSQASQAAGQIYRQYRLPAVTPTATSLGVTEDNPMYFRVVFNDHLQARFLAHYVKQVLRRQRVVVIKQTDTYGSNLADAFNAAAVELELEVDSRTSINPASTELQQELAETIEALENAGPLAVVFLAMQADIGSQLVKKIKDAGLKLTLIGPDSFASSRFLESLDRLDPAQNKTASYSNGVYMVTPLVADTANAQAQRLHDTFRAGSNTEPEWALFFGYDAALMLVTATRQAFASAPRASVKDLREKIAEALHHMDSPAKGLPGATGLNYFDGNGNVQKLISIGVYQNRQIISAPNQLESIRDPSELTDLAGDLEAHRVLLINNQYVYSTQVVYTGVILRELTDPDMAKGTYTLEFDLWFRYQGKFDPQAVQFLNTMEPVKLGEPLQSTQYRGIEYRLYRVRGRFKNDFIENFATTLEQRQHIVGVSFTHRDLSRNALVYAADLAGMGNPDTWLQETMHSQMLSLNPTYGWLPIKASFFQDTIRRSMAGNPQYLALSDGTLPYSRFNAGIVIQKDEILIENLIPPRPALIILAGCLLALLLLLSLKQRLEPWRRLIWTVEIILVMASLLTMEVGLLDRLRDQPLSQRELLKSVFDVLWWLTPAFLIIHTFELFLWRPLEQRSEQKVPNIVRGFISIFIYMIALLGIVAFVLHQPITSLLATSSILLMVVGLAVQLNISNIFSGIALNIERPFRIGDPIEINSRNLGIVKGKVVDINWRATRLRRDDNHIIVPNTQMAEARIINYNYPDNRMRRGFVVRVDPAHPPERVIAVLESAIAAVDGVEERLAGFMGVSEWAAEYWVEFHFHKYTKRHYYRDMIWQQVWHKLNAAGMPPITRYQEVQLLQARPEDDPIQASATDAVATAMVVDAPKATHIPIMQKKE